MCRLIQFFNEGTCYFEINVYLPKTVKFFSCCILHFYDTTCFPVFSIINNQSFFTESRRTLLLHIDLGARKKNKEFFSDFSGKWYLTFQILFYRKNKKNLFNSSSAETAHNVVNDNSQMSVRKKNAPKWYFSWTMDLLHPFHLNLHWCMLIHVKSWENSVLWFSQVLLKDVLITVMSRLLSWNISYQLLINNWHTLT